MRRSIRSFYIFSSLILIGLISANAQNDNETYKSITGIISYEGSPLNDVHISVSGTDAIEKSAKDGSYSIKARPGDKLQFSYVGFKSITILIEDVTQVLNIEMFVENNMLQEAVVRTKREGTVLQVSKKKAKTFQGAYGPINPNALGFAVDYIDGETLSPAAPNIAMALNGAKDSSTIVLFRNQHFLVFHVVEISVVRFPCVLREL